MLQIVVLLSTNYSNKSDIEDISDDCITEFINEMNFESISDLFLEIDNIEVKNIGWENRKDIKLIKLINFVYCSVMDFPENRFEIKTATTKKIVNSVYVCVFYGLTFLDVVRLGVKFDQGLPYARHYIPWSIGKPL